jgi:hypothetical protein
MHGELKFVKQNIKSIRIFDESYRVSENHIKNLIRLAKTLPYLKKLEYSAKTAAVIRKHLKSTIANRIFGEVGNSMVINKEEGIFSKSLEVLKKYNALLNIGKQKGSSFDY